MISLSTLEKLRQFDSPTICNIIEVFDVRPRHTGYMDARIIAAFPEMPPMVGFAATATFRASALPRGGEAYSSLDKQVERFGELSGPAVVVFQDVDSPSVAATFGEIMCTVYQAFGAVGLVTSGAGRDLDQVRKIGFPVFTNGTICSHGYSSIPQIHVPIHVGGIAIYPDDLLHGDCNGVTTIPQEIASEVADMGDAYVAAEMLIIEAMRTSPGNLRLLRERRAESNAAIAKLRAQVSRAQK
ncbi:MAG: RraA family protein [Chloroflexi bacterium]|nr:RraA family protein [Chloroflexota bacterium]